MQNHVLSVFNVVFHVIRFFFQKSYPSTTYESTPCCMSSYITLDATKIENRRFLEDTFAKGQKKTHKKKELVQRKIEPKKKCKYPL